VTPDEPATERGPNGERLSKNQAVLKILLGVLVAAGILGVFFFTHFMPFTFPNQQEQLTTLKAD
jgi:hypothetical protein